MNTNTNIEKTILSHLVSNTEFIKQVTPYLKPEYFDDYNNKILYNLINSFIIQYNNQPSKEALTLLLQKKDLSQEKLDECITLLDDLYQPRTIDKQFLINQTEEFCKSKSLYNALLKSIKIYDSKKSEVGKIPELLNDALATSFNKSIGQSFENPEERYNRLHDVEEKFEFDIELLNKITNNGLTRKTLNIISAGTGVGKSLLLSHLASKYYQSGKRVLYITLEMSESQILNRVDANLLNTPINELNKIPKDTYFNLVKNITQKSGSGKLVVKEYPTGCCNVNHIKALLNDLKLKQNFIPDIIIIDYLNIMASSRLPSNLSGNTYVYIKSIAEELRGLAVENNLLLWSATQLNRTGNVSNQIDISNISESFGLAHTADFMLGLVSTEELANANQILVTQLKNRYNDINYYKRFVVGIDRPKMRIYNLEESAQNNLVDQNVTKNNTSSDNDNNDKPIFDISTNNRFSRKLTNEEKNYDDWNF